MLKYYEDWTPEEEESLISLYRKTATNREQKTTALKRFRKIKAGAAP